MPRLYFGRDGLDPNRSSAGQDILLAELGKFDDYDLRYFSGPPQINPQDQVSPFSAYTRVVVHIDADEISGRFDREGYYLFLDLDPKDAAALLGIELPSR